MGIDQHQPEKIVTKLRQVDAFVDHYNHRRYHESLQNLTPAEVYYRRGHAILKNRETIRRKTIEARCSQHHKADA